MAAVGHGHDRSRLLIGRSPVWYQTTGTLRSPNPSLHLLSPYTFIPRPFISPVSTSKSIRQDA